MKSTRVKFGEWAPDLSPLEHKGVLQAKNCIPELDSFRSLNGLAPYTTALDSACLGAFWMQDGSGTVYNFAGDAGKLYELVGTTWTDRSKGGGYTATAWEFAKFGDRVIAVAAGEAPQYFDIGVSANFADLAGSPPQAARIAVVRDHVVLGDLQNAPNFIQWSAFNNVEDWTPDVATLADDQELFGRGGRVQRIVPGEYGVIFQEHAIYRLSPEVAPYIFRLDEVERGRGTPAPGSVAWLGTTVFYLGNDGFYVFDGNRSQPIGESRVNRWFFSQIDPSSFSTVQAAIDRRNRLVMWAFNSSGGAINDNLLIYNFGANRWSHAALETEIIADLISSGFTVDTLDQIISGGVDGADVSVDSPDFVGGNLSFIAFDSAHKTANFNGAALTAQIDSGEVSSPDGRRLYINEVRPLVSANGATVSVKMGSRDQQQSGLPSFGNAVALDGTGKANVRQNARYHQIRCEIAGDFEHAQGVEIRARAAGRR